MSDRDVRLFYGVKLTIYSTFADDPAELDEPASERGLVVLDLGDSDHDLHDYFVTVDGKVRSAYRWDMITPPPELTDEELVAIKDFLEHVYGTSQDEPRVHLIMGIDAY